MGRFGEPSYSSGDLGYEGPCQRDPGKDPSSVCPHLPGSAEKVLFLQSRVEAGERLWHKGDMTLESWPGYEETETEVLEENVFDLMLELIEGDDEDNG